MGTVSNQNLFSWVKELLPLYQWRLGLDMWDVEVVVGDTLDESVAYIEWDVASKAATVTFNQNISWTMDGQRKGLYNIPETLAHELVHLLFAETYHDQLLNALRDVGAMSPDAVEVVKGFAEEVVSTIAVKLVRSGALGTTGLKGAE